MCGTAYILWVGQPNCRWDWEMSRATVLGKMSPGKAFKVGRRNGRTNLWSFLQFSPPSTLHVSHPICSHSMHRDERNNEIGSETSMEQVLDEPARLRKS